MYFKETTHSPLSSILYMIFTAFQVLPLLLIIIFYSLIFHEVKKQVRNAKIQALDKKDMLDCHKATITIFLLVLTYIITWVPEWSLDFLFFLGIGTTNDTLYNMQIAARWVFFLSPVADPYIYALRHTKVQEELKRLLCPARNTLYQHNAYRGPFGKFRKLFSYQSLPGSYHSDIVSQHHVTNGGAYGGYNPNGSYHGSARTSITTTDSSLLKRGSSGTVEPNMLVKLHNTPETVV